MSQHPVSKARPGHWNDDVRWLLERIAGILAQQGRGTESTSLQRGIPASDVYHYISGSHVDVGSAEETTIQMPATTRSWRLRAITYHVTGGSAATYAPRLGQSSGFAADGPDDRLAIASMAVATPVNKVFCEAVPVRADASYRLYFRPGFASGADNDGTYQLWFEQVVETEESV